MAQVRRSQRTAAAAGTEAEAGRRLTRLRSGARRRPELAGDALPKVSAAALLIVGGHDPEVLTLNEAANQVMQCERRLEIVPGATYLFEEPGTSEIVAARAGVVREAPGGDEHGEEACCSATGVTPGGSWPNGWRC
ncbi:MAG TPA: hypothetical protein VGC09_10475 [Rhodopila sp.]